jgi:hypothetical protein
MFRTPVVFGLHGALATLSIWPGGDFPVSTYSFECSTELGCTLFVRDKKLHLDPAVICSEVLK